MSDFIAFGTPSPLRDYPVTFCGISRYLNGTAFIEQSFFNNLSIR
jgi:hypothetical protein